MLSIAIESLLSVVGVLLLSLSFVTNKASQLPSLAASDKTTLTNNTRVVPDFTG